MLEPGSIVTQNKTMINKINFKDNKKGRLSIVLFSYIHDDKLYYCTVPITNSTRGTYNTLISKNHCYIPYAVLGNTKLSVAKIDSAYIYPESNISDTNLKINYNLLERIYNKILNIEVEDFQKELYNFIKINIKDYMDNQQKYLKAEKKRLAKERKARRKELKMNYKK